MHYSKTDAPEAIFHFIKFLFDFDVSLHELMCVCVRVRESKRGGEKERNREIPLEESDKGGEKQKERTIPCCIASLHVPGPTALAVFLTGLKGLMLF